MSRARDLADYVSTGVTTDELNLLDGSDTGPLSHRNLIINGAMQVAQRGTSSTVNGYGTVDRFRSTIDGNDENATQAQHALTSSDTGPYEEGFRYSLQMTNGNQTSGAGTGDKVTILYRMEAQDIAQSGWNYTSSSSYITLSFWCKSSVSQNFYVRVTSHVGTSQNYVFETGSLTADTWTKITKTIPGNSNLQFDNNNSLGLDIEFTMFRGTGSTGSLTLDAWGTYNSSIRVPDMTSTWYTTNDATWELTGVQLERGQVATPFEHRSYGEELARCQRYFQKSAFSRRWTSTGSNEYNFFTHHYVTQMRDEPAEVFSGGSFTNVISSTENNFTEILTGTACQIGYRANASGANTQVSSRNVTFDAEL